MSTVTSVECNALGHHKHHYESIYCTTGVAQRATFILKWRHTHREPPGGSIKPFFVQIKQSRESKRIREHTGVLSTVARKFFSWNSSELGLCGKFTSSVLLFLYLWDTVTANSVVSRGMTKCISVAVLVLVTMGLQNNQGVQEELLPLAHPHALGRIRSVAYIQKHTHNSSDRPNSEWIFLHQTNSPCPLKERSI